MCTRSARNRENRAPRGNVTKRFSAFLAGVRGANLAEGADDGLRIAARRQQRVAGGGGGLGGHGGCVDNTTRHDTTVGRRADPRENQRCRGVQTNRNCLRCTFGSVLLLLLFHASPFFPAHATIPLLACLLVCLARHVLPAHMRYCSTGSVTSGGCIVTY